MTALVLSVACNVGGLLLALGALAQLYRTRAGPEVIRVEGVRLCAACSRAHPGDGRCFACGSEWSYVALHSPDRGPR